MLTCVRKRISYLALIIVALLLLGCSSARGLPPAPGQYEIKTDSLTWDGREYEFVWKDKNGELRRATGEKFKMVEDSRTFLEMGDGDPVIHLAKDEPVRVLGEDRDGSFTSSWYPFLLGATLGRGLGGPVVINQPYPGTPQAPPQQPTYHYPPSGSFGRGDTLQGSVTNDKPAAPDYGKVKPAPYAVSGQGAGTGGGTAATNKSTSSVGGQSGGTGAGTAATNKGTDVTGQSGGTGTGSAATNKGGFAAGKDSYRSKSGSGSTSQRPAPSSSGSSGGGLSSGSKGGTSSGVSGGKSSGGFSGGGGGSRRSSGGGRRR